MIKLNIDGREVSGFEGQTILEIARENGIEIPTLCHDDRVKMYGSCGLCVVEPEGGGKLMRSCSTAASDGMVLFTDSERVRRNRKTALELLLSDHTGDCRPPCALACPAGTDCQGYAGLIANGEYDEALELVKEKIPLPASIGRVCPHPCEEACRRTLVEEPVAIAALKQFVGDMALRESAAVEDVPETGGSVAVIGGGPGGLTAAYFLRKAGHSVTVYDAMPLMGGMLRYGIPEYRLPKKVLQDEIDLIENMGVKFINNIKIGRDITLDYLRENYSAVIIAAGAWSSTGLRCPGEELEGVLGGIDFLREAAMGKAVPLGRRVAVVGGGNTAMDACRTAVRLGAEEVYNIYRRTKNEMPAEEIEIIEAEEEGVVFKNLTNPIEITGENGKVKAVRLQIMELGEPDASGRRAPVPVAGREEVIEVDTVIAAIGQKFDAKGFESVGLTKWNTVSADEKSFRTNIEGVFAVGDATNNGADIAIAAIAEAQKAAAVVDAYLNGAEISYEAPFLAVTEKTAEDFADRAKEARVRTKVRAAKERRNDFLEINSVFTEEEAKREASRCLECGCQDYFECKLIEYANTYKAQTQKFDGKVHSRTIDDTHPFITRNPDKCILCGLCVRICDEVVGATALGLVNRGFDTVVRPALDMELKDTDCIACGQCVSVCPTGALVEKKMSAKQVPLRETAAQTICSFCSVGCKSSLTVSGSTLLRNLPAPEPDSLLCVKGRFGFGEIAKKERITAPLIREGNAFRETGYEEAVVHVNKSLQSITARYGAGSAAVAVSGRYTNEEALLIKEYAFKTLGFDSFYSFGLANGGLLPVLGRDASTVSFEEMENTELIVAVDYGIMKNHAVAGMRIKRAVNNGAKLLLLTAGESLLDSFATFRLDIGSDLSLLPQIAKAVAEAGAGRNTDGFDKYEESLKDFTVSESAKLAADMILKARRAVFVFERNALSKEGAKLVAGIAVTSRHINKARAGIIQLLPDANSQGLINLSAGSGGKLREAIESGKVRALLIFGEDVKDADLSKLEFLAVQELHLTETAAAANVVLPAASYAESKGSYTAADGRVQSLTPAVERPAGVMANTALVEKLAEQAGVKLGEFVTSGGISIVIDPSGYKPKPFAGELVRQSYYPVTNSLSVGIMEIAATL